MKKILLSAILIPLFFSAGANEVTQTIRGTVMDRQSRITLPGATVLLIHTDPVRGTSSDLSGNFRLESVEVGRVSIRVSYVGYYDMILNNLSLQAGKELVLNIYLDEMVLSVDEVSVRYTADKTSSLNTMASVSARGFTVEETERYAGSRNDPARMAANFAGVVGVDDSRNDIIIRGNSPLGLLWRLEGVDIPSPNHWGMTGNTGGPVSMLNNTLLENSDFITGAFPAEYGNALSGVFDLRMRNGNNEKYEFLGQIGFNGLEIGAEGPVSREKGSSFLINYRYSTMGVFDALGMDFGTMGVPYYQDLSFKLNFPGTPLGHISMFGLGGISYIEIWDSRKDTTEQQLNFYGDEGWDITSGTDMGVAGITSHYTINPNTFLKVTLAAMGQHSSNRVDTLGLDLARFLFFQNAMTDNRLSASAIMNHRFNTRHLIRGGITSNKIYGNFIDSVYHKEFGHYRRQFDYNGSTWLFQPYIQYQFRPGNRVTLNAGLHYNRFAFNSSHSLEPRAGVRVQTAPGQTFNFGYGLHSQISPIFTYFYQIRDADGSYRMTNRGLGLTRSHHLVAGYDIRISDHSRVRFETYYQNIFDAPVDARESNSFSMLNNGASFEFSMPEYLANKGRGENYGIELTLERFLHEGLYYLLTASLFESKYTGSSNMTFNTAFNNNYVANALIGREFNLTRNNPSVRRSLVIDLKTMIAGGKRTTPWTAFFNDETREYEREWDHGRAFEIRLDDYHKTDLKVIFRSNKRSITREWGVEITNLFNTKNIFGDSFNKYTGEAEYVYQLGMMVIPQFRIIF
jgi:hypothetical protein